MNTETKNAIDRLVATVGRRSREFEALLRDEPPEGPCGLCGHPGAKLNAEASWAAGAFRRDCPHCAETEKLVEFQRKQRAAGIPVDVMHATLKNFSKAGVAAPNSDDQRRFMAKAQAFSHRKIRNLIMAGTPGIGKGHLAAAIANQWLEAGDSVRWRVMHRLFEASHRAYEDGNRESLLTTLATRDLLVLDEIAMCDMPKDGERFVYDIVDLRQKNKAPTIFLSNKTAAVIKNWLGPATVDRLRSGGVDFLWGDWPSMRGTPSDRAF